MNTSLVVLIVSLPPNPSSLRMRRLQQVLTHGLTIFEGLYAAVPGKD
jgi:hypothetical protein